ncbi:glycoside hydrolase family protein [Roseovarius carneus]|uniref:hypothetical protein n=1 Tax=Roseovarius carneus TaxID=2853164 RepID=UPI001CCDB992|nr:hypothetical protein [Roseovarius carneus]
MGKLFDPTEHALSNNCETFAQSPQTLVMEDRVRVFFSTRERDNTGKFLSHIAYADFAHDMQTLLGVAQHTVLPLGDLGCFDEHGVFPINVLRDGDRVLGYTTGWNRKVSVSADAAIGLVISHDNGETFQRHGAGGPLLAPSLHEPLLVGDAFVQKFDGTYHMWYIFGTKWQKFDAESPPDRVYKIAYATSPDGIAWQRDGRAIIADTLNPDECQALPTVIQIEGRYHMFFCYREAFGFRTDSSRGYRLGAAWSDDLTTWTRDDSLAPAPSQPGAWDSDMRCYPHVFRLKDKVYMLYNGNAFGREGFGVAVLDG